MTSTDVASDASTEVSAVRQNDFKLEVVTLPVSNVDRAKRFYQGLGWRLDADISDGEDFRVVQFTPPHSLCSIHFGIGLTAAEPGAVDRLILAVEDIDAARDELIALGVEVTEVETQPRPPAFPLPDRSYLAYASFKDPDGNGWLLQEITSRLPGREWED